MSQADVGRAGWVPCDPGCDVCARWVPFWVPTLARLGLGAARRLRISASCGLRLPARG